MNTDRRFWIALGGFILFIGVVCFFPFWFTNKSFRDIDFSSTGQIGDTIGGIMTPFIAIAASILTFLAFWVQYQANVEQRRQFLTSLNTQKQSAASQDLIWRVERFENRFYEMIKLHKSNVDEMNIANKIKGRKCFIPMFYELKFCYLVTKDFYDTMSPEDKETHEYSNINILDLAYKIFFYGLGYHSEKNYVDRLKIGEKHLFDFVKRFLEQVQNKYGEHTSPASVYYYSDKPLKGSTDERTAQFNYKPYDGHVNRLGHYYRHLFQTANYIISQSFLQENEKYSYIKTLRAQLSNFEQLMLYYNALAWFDDEWKELFTKYRLIKNLPIPLADFHISPLDHFRQFIVEFRERGQEMFEFFE